MVIHVEGVNITGGFFEDDFTVDANGQNFFTVTAINGQLITSISLTAINGAMFEDIRQVRLGGSEIVETVPEPASMVLAGNRLNRRSRWFPPALSQVVTPAGSRISPWVV